MYLYSMGDKTQELIKNLQEFAPDTINGAVIFHIDKETRQLKSISPLCPFKDIQDMYTQLSSCRDAIHQFLNDLVDKGLAKN